MVIANESSKKNAIMCKFKNWERYLYVLFFLSRFLKAKLCTFISNNFIFQKSFLPRCNVYIYSKEKFTNTFATSIFFPYRENFIFYARLSFSVPGALPFYL